MNASVASSHWSRPHPTELLGFFDSIEIDPDFPDFVDHVIGLGASLEVVSDGIEQGIARILARNYVSLLPILANRLRQVDHDSWRIDFPHASDACRAAVRQLQMQIHAQRPSACW